MSEAGIPPCFLKSAQGACFEPDTNLPFLGGRKRKETMDLQRRLAGHLSGVLEVQRRIADWGKGSQSMLARNVYFVNTI